MPEPITINGQLISDETIFLEIQRHPAPSFQEARKQAILAIALKIVTEQAAEKAGSCVDDLLSSQVCQDVGTEEVERFYRQNSHNFTSIEQARAYLKDCKTIHNTRSWLFGLIRDSHLAGMEKSELISGFEN